MKVVIDRDVHQKVMFWTHRAKFKEVSGLGKIVVDREAGTLRVVSAMLLPQVNHSAHTEIDAAAVCKAMYALRDEPGDLNWWWHSHVQMPVFWSGTDKDTIKEWGDNGWVLATVFNQKGEYRSAYYSKDGMRTPLGVQPLFLDELPTEFGQISVNKDWEQSYLDNVENYKPVPRYSGTGYLSGPGNTVTPVGDSPAFQAMLTIDKLPDERPVGLTKREWKRIKALRRGFAAVEGLKPKRPPTLVHDARDYENDVYGLSQAERTFLAKEGYDDADLDYLVENDFSPQEILELAEGSVSMKELKTMLQYGTYDASDVMRAFYEAQAANGVPEDDTPGLPLELTDQRDVYPSYPGACDV